MLFNIFSPRTKKEEEKRTPPNETQLCTRTVKVSILPGVLVYMAPRFISVRVNSHGFVSIGLVGAAHLSASGGLHHPYLGCHSWASGRLLGIDLHRAVPEDGLYRGIVCLLDSTNLHLVHNLRLRSMHMPETVTRPPLAGNNLMLFFYLQIYLQTNLQWSGFSGHWRIIKSQQAMRWYRRFSYKLLL